MLASRADFRPNKQYRAELKVIYRNCLQFDAYERIEYMFKEL